MTRVLGFGTYDVAAHPRVGVLLEGLASTPGWTVRELDVPLGLSTAERVAILKQPWRLPVLAGRLASRWGMLVAGSRRFRGTRAPEALLVGYMGHFDVLLARALYPRTTIILDHLIFAAGTARDRGEAGLRAGALEVLDALATRTADVVVLDTAENAARLAVGRRAVVVPVGAPSSWYGAGRLAAPGRREPRRDEDHLLSVIFFGLFTPLQGAPTIARALRLLSERGAPVRATLVGTGQDRDECERILQGVPVRWVDWVGADELARVVASHDVCLGIMGTTPKARDVVPNKVFQGMAAGCAVVTSDTAPQRRALGGGAVLVEPGDHRALADALETLATDPQALARAWQGASQAARAYTPQRVVAPLVAGLGRLRGGPR
ncbi:MAG: glycosyltransferase family 4 protein [Actinomyces sp.]|uniref:glycosyltransferase family 4 protein n=1 Tax=Actinomyces sp. TaxID=29317 RepID=UPI0026DCB6E8|nr:glycosyltransferase family 4 protein [Actinomyces sp.]MDO4242236.1 glycosyltransferase family 4 protein [Actinomyces sp.]